MDRQLSIGAIYQHFKSDEKYRIIAFAKHTETNENLVIYEALYGNFQIYARPYEMFNGYVDKEKYPDVKQIYRFQEIDAGVV